MSEADLGQNGSKAAVETNEQRIVREMGLCGELLDGGRSICIRDAGHREPHGESQLSPSGNSA